MPTASTRGRCRNSTGPSRIATSTSCLPMTRRLPLAASSNWSRPASRGGSASIPSVTSKCFCPMNRGGVGARSLNIELQAALNPAGERKVERFGWTFAPGDKVMQIENDYDKEVYNGDIGYIDDVDPNAGEVIASFDGRPATYGFGEPATWVPAYPP